MNTLPVPAVIRWLKRPLGLKHPPPAAAFDPRDFQPALKTQLLVLQATPFCNLDCDYCYLPQRDSTARMALDTVRQAALRLVQDDLLGPQLKVVWHAGEPLVVPPAWYAQAFSILQEILGPHTRLQQALQTNATLIDDAWCELFQRHGVEVGISLDGPASLHDRHRRTRRGQGTHARALRGMAHLRRWGLPFHVIAVVTRDALATPAAMQEFIDFFETENIVDFGCNIDEAEGIHGECSWQGEEAAHAQWLALLQDRFPAGQGRLRVRELERAREAILNPLPRFEWRGRHWPSNPQVLPFAIISVAHDGTFSTFSPELMGQRAAAFNDFVFGNVRDQRYLSAAHDAAFCRVWQAVARGIEHCARHCEYFEYCGGGAPANKWHENGDLASGETLYCRSMLQRPFNLVLSHLEQDHRAEPSGLSRFTMGEFHT